MDASRLRRQLNLTLPSSEMPWKILDGKELEGMSTKQLLPGVPVGWEEQEGLRRIVSSQLIDPACFFRYKRKVPGSLCHLMRW